MLPLRIWNGRALIYLYRPKALARDLACEDAACLLNGSGYDGTEPSGCLRCLMDRLQCQKDGFPHEIGLFLGYPPEDVRGFIENETRNYKFTGYWKVYGDEGARAPCSTSSNAARAAIWPPGPVGPGWSGSLWPSEPELP